jgi:hypothetical protein
MDSNYYEISDLFVQDETPTTAEWNERVFYLPQAEFNARWQNFSIWLTAPTVNVSGQYINVSDVDAIVDGIHYTGTGSADTSTLYPGVYHAVLDNAGAITIVSSITDSALSIATFEIVNSSITNFSTSGILARLFMPWVEVVGESDEDVVVWWVNNGRGGIKRDTDGQMMVSDDGTSWERLAGRAVSPLVENDTTHSIQRTNDYVTGNARGAKAIDLAYERTIAAQVAAADYSAILSGLNQQNDNLKGAIVGGSNNRIRETDMNFPYGEAYYGRSFIGAGYGNYMGPNNRCCFIGTGYINQIDGNNVSADTSMCIIVGGNQNTIVRGSVNAMYCHFIGGGQLNSITGAYMGSIVGGESNIILDGASHGAIGGGKSNQIYTNGTYGCVPGGRSNVAGAYCFAAGYNAQANTGGSFCFADGTLTQTARANQAKFGVDGGFTIRNNAGTFDLYASGGYWLTTPNGGCYLGSDGVWYSASSRELKYDFQVVNTADILQKVSETTLEEWRYNATPEAKHIGVVAEDFAEKFSIGNNPESLNPLDVCGVLWAAVQELTKKVAELEAKLEK